MSQQKKSNVDYESLIDFQTKLEGVSNGLSKEIIEQLDATDQDILKIIREDLKKDIDRKNIKKEVLRLKKVCEKLYQIRKSAIDKSKEITIKKCRDVAYTTQQHDKKFCGQYGRVINLIKEKKLKDIIDYSPFNGATISEWFHNYAENDKNRIASAIMRATTEGLSLQDVIKVVMGTKADGYSGGVLKTSRTSARTIARTLVNGVSNETRMSLLEENTDVLDGIQFLATLDGKTSFICASLDGTIWKNNQTDQIKRPPLHPNCRSTLIPYLEIRDEDGNLIEDPVGRPAANADFDKLAEDAYNKQARDKGWNRRYSDLSASTRLRYYYKAQKDYEAETGKPAYRNVSGKTTFRDYFEKQPEEFKRSWLGSTRYQLYKDGKLNFEQLVKSDAGHIVSIEELKKSMF